VDREGWLARVHAETSPARTVEEAAPGVYVIAVRTAAVQERRERTHGSQT
jgi:hypothetical protein